MFRRHPLALAVPSLTLTNFSLGFGDANVTLAVAGDLTITATGFDGLSFAADSALHVGGNITVTNAFLCH